MKKLYAVIAFLAMASSLTIAQTKSTGTKAVTGPFEGIIDFMQSNGIDTSLYKYSIKGNNVRIENYDPRTKNSEGIYLIDLSTKKMTALSPVRKIYFDQSPTGAAAQPSGTAVVTKTANVKKINGYTCTEYDVTDATEGTKIAYWMASGHFDFFNGMMQVLNRKDKFSEYYMQIKNSTGMFPMLAIQYDMSGNNKGEMKAQDVKRAVVTDDNFKIPAGYKEFKK